MSVVEWKELVRRLNLNTGFFETSRYTIQEQMGIIAGGYDGAGMSAGNLQYNYGSADRLQELFSHMVQNYPEVVKASFEANTAEYDTFVHITNTYTRLQRVEWGESITDWSDGKGRKLLEPWNSIFSKLLVQPETVAKYLEMQDKYYLPPALELFKQLSCKSQASLASLFDIFVNRGRYYPCNLLTIEFEKIDNDTTLLYHEKEAIKVTMINAKGNDPTNALGETAELYRERRGCMADRGGDYYGSPYEPETQFGISLDPATTEKIGSTIELGSFPITDLITGESSVERVSMIAELKPEPFTVAKKPVTQFRITENHYKGIGDVSEIKLVANQPLWVDVRNWVACRTYYTTDGTIPTAESNLYTGALTFTKSCELKTVTISESGLAEDVKTLRITIPSWDGYKYVKFEGLGDNKGVTTRLVELQAFEGSINRLLDFLPIAGEAPNGGGSIAKVTDGKISYTTGEYTYWWSEGVPTLIYDLGAHYPIDMLKVAMYSPESDPRQTQFKLYISKDNIDWILVADMSQNTLVQPLEGWSFTIS